LEREKIDRNVEAQHLTVKLNAANETLVHATKQAQLYHDLIAMPRRKRDKVIVELRVEMGVKEAKTVRVKEVTKDGLIEGLSVKSPSKKNAKKIFDLAKDLDIELDPDLPSTLFPWIWYNQGRIESCIDVSVSEDTYVTASEFMTRMRNHVGK
jgi:hypothetical protein